MSEKMTGSRPLVERVIGSIDMGEKLDEAAKPALVTSEDPVYGVWARQIAQELHTAKYLEMGYIDEANLNPDGLYLDEYTERATYLVSESRMRLSTCRYISATEQAGLASLPTAKSFSLNSALIAAVAEVDTFADIAHSEVIEVSGLVSLAMDATSKNQGDTENDADVTQSLYAAILRASVEKGHKLWLLNTQPKLVRFFRALVGPEHVHIIGPAQKYMNITTFPIAINPHQVIAATLRDESTYGANKRTYLRRAFEGVDAAIISDALNEFLRNDNT